MSTEPPLELNKPKKRNVKKYIHTIAGLYLLHILV